MVHINDHGAIPDGRLELDGAIYSGTRELSSPSYKFGSSDVGKAIYISGAFNNGVLGGVVESVSGGNAIVTGTANVTQTSTAYVFGTDNTSAIQAAINKAVGDTAQFGRGMYLHRALDVTARPGTILQGCGGAYGGTQLLPCTENVTALDTSGSGGAQLRNMWIGHRFNPSVPKVGVLHAPTPSIPGLDFIAHENIVVTGRYYMAALYNFGAGTSVSTKSAYWNFAPAAWLGERYAAVFSLDNSMAVTSQFVELAITGTANAWTFTNSEFHDLSGGGPDFGALLLRGASDHVYLGGVISGSSKLITCKAPFANTPPRRHSFIGVRFENEAGSPQPTNVLNLYSDIEQAAFIKCMQGQSGSFATGAGQMVNCSVI